MANSVVVRHGKQSTNNEYLKSFPPFLWLLRDTLVKMPKNDGKELTPTEYLTTEVLCGDNLDSMEMAVRGALTELFPCFECETLPPPSTDVDVMMTVTTNQEKLNPLFNKRVNKLIAFLKEHVQPKQVFSNAGPPCDGRTLALLVQQVAKAVNDPNSIPALDNTWKLVVQSRCRDVQEKLVAEYCTTIKTCYDSASKGYPLEEETESSQEQCVSVIGIHNKLWTEIKEKLHEEIGPLLSVPESEECTLESVTSQLENQLVQFQWETIPHTHNRVRRVTGGALYATAEENRKRSREYCNKLFADLFTQIRRRVESANEGYTTETLEADIENLLQEYDRESVGPEKTYIRDKMDSHIEENRRMLQEWLQRAQDRKELREFYKKIDTKFEKRVQEEEERREKAERLLEETQKLLDEERKRKIQETQKLTEERHKREIAEENLQHMNKTLEERQQVAQERFTELKQRTEKAEARLETVTSERDKLKEQLTMTTVMKNHAEERLADKANHLREKTEEAKQLTKEVDDKTKEAKEKTKEAEEKTKEAEEKTKEAEELEKYIETFENSDWLTRLFWGKREQKILTLKKKVQKKQRKKNFEVVQMKQKKVQMKMFQENECIYK